MTPSEAYVRHQSKPSRLAVMWTNTVYFKLDILEYIRWNLNQNLVMFIEQNEFWECRLQIDIHYVSTSMC